MKKKNLTIRDSQDAFLKRKVGELKRLVPPGDEGSVTESRVIQGLLDFWIAFEARRKPRPDISHKVVTPKKSQGATGSANSQVEGA
mgnify:CR=1 FL=1